MLTFSILRFSQFFLLTNARSGVKTGVKAPFGCQIGVKFSEYFSTKNKVAQAAKLRLLCDLILFFILCEEERASAPWLGKAVVLTVLTLAPDARFYASCILGVRGFYQRTSRSPTYC